MYFKNSSLNYIPTTFGGEPKFITLTDKGRAYLKERNAIMTDIAQDITNDLNSEDIENVRQVLEVINHRIKTYSNHK
ncbi:Teicoplanin-resistance associated HTH-type transcriptional regulator TcaR [Staphylococcus aureus]|uniref:Teicoplanin-resistance associated HTH-type transcriptional regulator TcaR n=1 Tax=Staphylococcus aureus TaxID=1280 RepID=A0A380EMN3_STAAU|nr:Teicoplanin-resistance associated HTH-type transcriptional regulator TcaR [Staphylococcus aureus]